MAELVWSAEGEVRLAWRAPTQIVSLVARRGALAKIAAKIEGRFGLSLPAGPRRSAGRGLSVLGLGPGRWLIVRDEADCAFEVELAADLSGLAAVCLQSDAYDVFEICGPKARAVLAKGPPIDLHPNAFGPSDVAVTIAAHIGVVLWQVDDAPTFRLAVHRSYGRDFWERLCQSAAEFGVQPES